VFDFSVAGDDEPVPMIERNFADRMRAEPDPRVKLEIFAGHMSESMPRSAPIYRLARDAAASEAEIARLLNGWRDDQLAGLGSPARGLSGEGRLRPGLTPEKARDLLWTIRMRSLRTNCTGWGRPTVGTFNVYLSAGGSLHRTPLIGRSPGHSGTGPPHARHLP
jgi:hypothetical protein